MHQVLTETQNTSDIFYLRGGDQSFNSPPGLPGMGVIMLTDHAGGTWTLRFRNPDGDWWDTDITFTGDGIKDFRSAKTIPWRLTGGDAGAKAWANAVWRIE